MLSSARMRHRQEDGATLVELLVVIGLLGVVTSGLTSGIIGGFRATALVQQRTQAMSDLQVSVERVGRELRAAAPVQLVTTGANRSIHVRAFRPGSCVRITYRVEGTELAQYTQTLSPQRPPSGTPLNAACTTPAAVEPPPSTAVRRVLVHNLASGTSFVYRRADGSVMDFSVIGAGRPLESDIRTIELTVRRNVPRSPALQVQTTVVVRNQAVSQ